MRDSTCIYGGLTLVPQSLFYTKRVSSFFCFFFFPTTPPSSVCLHAQTDLILGVLWHVLAVSYLSCHL